MQTRMRHSEILESCMWVDCSGYYKLDGCTVQLNSLGVGNWFDVRFPILLTGKVKAIPANMLNK